MLELIRNAIEDVVGKAVFAKQLEKKQRLEVGECRRIHAPVSASAVVEGTVASRERVNRRQDLVGVTVRRQG